ncbi:uncharacterized protein MONOS_11409 [Monocercomonoides exilis]|uniref:uncharacterized protein n=1 Tax=Monocercomonoides exilis TaxID=2049356 RepID=UPI003559A5C9|nr:hypothetical protein MONOS_11409 [Monocercomonoides exilis]|eukprot:MONOS_11409.1-p1 / transcript=MONOS_11409.1 / gene=MONOS_11409 / organism=Monocercomonoides_exilis_PA203 / gene_product=unspecified product / transcript_product=unspecified product / location=Mono_scaffold00570:30178-31480(-) / protein_length=187 / sequence_SO=supercontig / SO=protein_coding / is_pseudo=false
MASGSLELTDCAVKDLCRLRRRILPVSVANYEVILTDCTFSVVLAESKNQSDERASKKTNEEGEGDSDETYACSWETGFMKLKDCSTSMNYTIFANCSAGALDEAALTLYPPAGGDGSATGGSNFWLENTDCTLTKGASEANDGVRTHSTAFASSFSFRFEPILLAFNSTQNGDNFDYVFVDYFER